MDNLRALDPRYYQLAVLGSLIVWGITTLDFGIRWQHALLILATALGVQWQSGRLAGLERLDPLSALITALSLTLLLRTDSPGLAVLAAAIAIGSKFIVRLRGKHVFNPANLALVVLTLASDRAWLASGQWGSAVLGAFALACLGLLVLSQARRMETTAAFLAGFAGLVLARAAWLGDPLAIPLHQLQNGALLVFAFFMISDPKTTPDSAAGRWVYGLLVAGLAFVLRFVFHEPDGPILALVMTAPLVPLIDRVSRGRQYEWQPARVAPSLDQGDS